MIENIIINSTVALIFFLFGYLIKYKKKYHLIAGLNDYNPKNPAIAKKYNVEKIGNVMGNSAFICGITMIILTVFDVNLVWIYLISLLVFFLNILIFYKWFKKRT